MFAYKLTCSTFRTSYVQPCIRQLVLATEIDGIFDASVIIAHRQNVCVSRTTTQRGRSDHCPNITCTITPIRITQKIGTMRFWSRFEPTLEMTSICVRVRYVSAWKLLFSMEIDNNFEAICACSHHESVHDCWMLFNSTEMCYLFIFIYLFTRIYFFQLI